MSTDIDDLPLPTPSPERRRMSSRSEKALLASITTLLQHYFLKDLDETSMTIMVEDWMQALDQRKLATVVEARRLWLTTPGTGTRAPKIAEIIALCDRIDSGGETGSIGAPPDVLAPAHRGPFAKATSAEKWSWYARMHAFCDATGKDRHFDSSKKFYHDDLVAMARTEYQRDDRAARHANIRLLTLGEPARHHSVCSPGSVRSYWRTLRPNEMSDAELAIAGPAIASMSADLQRNISALAKRMRMPSVIVPIDVTVPPDAQQLTELAASIMAAREIAPPPPMPMPMLMPASTPGYGYE